MTNLFCFHHIKFQSNFLKLLFNPTTNPRSGGPSFLMLTYSLKRHGDPDRLSAHRYFWAAKSHIHSFSPRGNTSIYEILMSNIAVPAAALVAINSAHQNSIACREMAIYLIPVGIKCLPLVMSSLRVVLCYTFESC